MIGEIMQMLFWKYMSVRRIYNIQKRWVDIVVSVLVLMFGFFIFIFYGIKNKVILKKDIFIRNDINDMQLYRFNTSFVWLKNIPLFYLVLKGKMSFVGLAFTSQSFAQHSSEKVGLCSLWFIRKSSKMPNILISQCDEEYLKHKGFMYDFKIVIKSLFSLLYYKESITYKSKVNLLDIPFDNLTLQNILLKIETAIQKKEKKSIFFVNADCLNKSVEDYAYKDTLQKGDYILPDGSGINVACNMIDNPLKENLNGTDLFPHICKLAQTKSYRLFLMGAREGVAQMMKNKLEKSYPSLKIVGTHHGYVKEDKMQSLIDEINKTKPDILFVALGAPFQELFIQRYKEEITANLFLGVGGLFDFYSLKTKRAPLFVREIGFEWVYRMIQEPKRMWKRYIIGNPQFLYRIYKYKKNMGQNLLIDNYLQYYTHYTLFSRLKNKLWALKTLCSVGCKRMLDIFVSTSMLLVLLPLFSVVAVCIRLESKGNVIFSHNRVGKDATIFKMYKFRSMVRNAQEMKNSLRKQNESKDGIIFKMKEDPRITRVGKFIRKTSIDELPQLWNVLRGEMSLVGPRPPLPSEVKLYSIEERKRLDVKPGITCIWQVSGRSEISFKQQVLMDKKYIKEHSFIYDIILLLKTIPAVLSSKGSY